MRKKLGKAVRELFDDGVKAQLPNFVHFPMVEKGPFGLTLECRAYRWNVQPGLAFFLVAKPSIREPDAFWIYAGWSQKNDHSDWNLVDRLFDISKLWNASNSCFTWELT